jgi:hypothetical protein
MCGAPPKSVRIGRERNRSNQKGAPQSQYGFLFTGWRKKGAWPQNWGSAPRVASTNDQVETLGRGRHDCLTDDSGTQARPKASFTSKWEMGCGLPGEALVQANCRKLH